MQCDACCEKPCSQPTARLTSCTSAQLVTPSAEGGLLLWAGGAVSALVLRPDGLPAHVGGVHVLAGGHSDNAAAERFYSAGADGCGGRNELSCAMKELAVSKCSAQASTSLLVACEVVAAQQPPLLCNDGACDAGAYACGMLLQS